MEKVFSVEVKCSYVEWSRYDLFMTAVCFDAAGEMTDYVNLDRKGNDPGKAAVLKTPPCNRADVYIYVIAREFPASDIIAKSPPFDIEVVVWGGSEKPSATSYPVNQWGGLSLKLQC